MRVVCIGQVWPEPTSSAAGSRLLQLLHSFRAQGWRVTFACAAERTEHSADLTAQGINELPIALNCSSFNTQLAEWQPDLVLFDRYLSEEQFGWRVARTCPDAMRVLDTEDLHSLRYARERLLKQQSGDEPVNADAEALYGAMANDDIALREVAAIYRSDMSLMISEAEMALLQETFGVPASLLHYIPFMVEPEALSTSPGFAEREHFVTIGNFRHGPNWDAVRWLKSDLWPALRARVPGAQLHIYGAYVAPKATQLHNPGQGFHVCGRAVSVEAVMGRARVCLAPLRFGAGLKGKLLDALRTQTPSVTTAIGAEGMAGSQSWPGALANTAADFAEAAAALYTDAARWQTARARCLPLLRERFDAGVHRTALIERLCAVRTHLREHRQRNFTGALLNHHHHKSTQYMSQWIEAKQRLRNPE
ncbi:glycosyltransferase [Marinimicrobium alkaliphilum]|uniref:glycosyltransferase n=1 Tax=Marinimicrobium alkaliphilum TaxID=2202654 RepID=UPI000DBA1183|nr:glycosyltransferase family 4 protein [Marinimicrobium alkaliphilum]